MESEVISLAKALISRKSITPDDAGCQDIFIERLERLGFVAEEMVFEDTRNLWLRKGDQSPCFVFAGHTDVVPAGDESQWIVNPFEPEVIDGYLYGRGSADMKGSLACMIVAVERFLAQTPNHKGSIAFLITSDEEGPFINGTTRVIDTLEARNEKFEWCIVGEPSSTSELGDVVKNGRRGSLTGDLIIYGKQGHVAYPHLADNPIHKALAALDELAKKVWDEGNEFFPPSSFQIANIQAGVGVSNVVPGILEVQFNFRFSTEQTAVKLQEQVVSILRQHQLEYQIDWTLSGNPFLTPSGDLVDATIGVIHKVAGFVPQLLTTGGTSDGRFIAPTGAQVIELGPVNATIHQVNECVKAADLAILTDMYQRILVQLLATRP